MQKKNRDHKKEREKRRKPAHRTKKTESPKQALRDNSKEE